MHTQGGASNTRQPQQHWLLRHSELFLPAHIAHAAAELTFSHFTSNIAENSACRRTQQQHKRSNKILQCVWEAAGQRGASPGHHTTNTTSRSSSIASLHNQRAQQTLCTCQYQHHHQQQCYFVHHLHQQPQEFTQATRHLPLPTAACLSGKF